MCARPRRSQLLPPAALALSPKRDDESIGRRYRPIPKYGLITWAKIGACSIPPAQFQKLAVVRWSQEQLAVVQSYFTTVDFDFAVKALDACRSAAYLGFAIRADTGFAEVIALASDPAETDAIGPCLLAAVRELQKRKAIFLGTKPLPAEGASEIILRFGFKRVSAELFLSKSI